MIVVISTAVGKFHKLIIVIVLSFYWIPVKKSLLPGPVFYTCGYENVNICMFCTAV